MPCICTNPDLHKLVGDTLLPAAGAIAALYEEMGGVVTRIGKPHIDIYQHAHALCRYPGKARIVSIGDSLDHDIRGAVTFGIDSVLVRTGGKPCFRDCPSGPNAESTTRTSLSAQVFVWDDDALATSDPSNKFQHMYIWDCFAIDAGHSRSFLFSQLR